MTASALFAGSAKAREDRDARALWLRRKYKSDEAAQALAVKLEGCSPRRPCDSGACDVCNEVAQQELVDLIRGPVGRRALTQQVGFYSIVLLSGAVPLGQLRNFRPDNLKRRFRYAIRRAQLDWFVGALDYVFVEHCTGRYPAAFQVHGHGMGGSGDMKASGEGLRESIKPTDAIPKPVNVKVWDGCDRALKYPFKTRFDRRIGRDDGWRYDKRTGQWRISRVTQYDLMRSRERLELLLHLDAIGMHGRLLLRNLELHEGSEGLKLRFVPR